MRVSSVIRFNVLAALLFLWCATTSWAGPVKITIEPSGSMGGFGYSLIHAGSSESGSHPGYYTGGTHLYDNITGFLLGDLSGDPGSLTLLNIMGSLTTNIVGLPGAATISITSGSLAQQANGFVDGELDYILTGGPNAGSGTFYFDAINFMNNGTGPNRLSETSLVLWANNWDYGSGASRPNSGALGVDLKGTINAVPEPSTVVLMATGLAALMGWRYRKSHK